MKKSELKAIIKECIIAEGLESKVLGILEDEDINAYFENGTCYVMNKKDLANAKEILRRHHDIHKVPPIEIVDMRKKY